MTKLLECTRVLTCLFLLLTSVICLADDTSLWKIQKTLAGKKYIDLTHEFAPGIPRWSGFPDETRKTVYWYDKRPDTMGAGFFAELFTHVGQVGDACRSTSTFRKGIAHCRSNRSEGDDPATGRCGCSRGMREKSRLHVVARTREKVGD